MDKGQKTAMVMIMAMSSSSPLIKRACQQNNEDYVDSMDNMKHHTLSVIYDVPLVDRSIAFDIPVPAAAGAAVAVSDKTEYSSDAFL
jgi:hypothetical protein